MNTILPCYDDNLRPDTIFNSSVVHMKRVPKKSLIPLAVNRIPKVNDFCETRSNIALWCLLLSSEICFWAEKPPREGKRQRSSLSESINNQIWDSVIEKNPKRDRKPQQKSELGQLLRSIRTKLDGGKGKAGVRMEVSKDKITDFTVDATLKLKHPRRENCSVPDPTDIDCFSISEFFVHKALKSFPNGSSAGSDFDGISAQVSKICLPIPIRTVKQSCFFLKP